MEVDGEVHVKQEHQHDAATDIIITGVNDNTNAARNCYMHHKDVELQQENENDQLATACFYTTIAIDFSISECIVVNNVLIDSGASAYFIHRKLVNELELNTVSLPRSQEFAAAGGSSTAYTEYV